MIWLNVASIYSVFVPLVAGVVNRKKLDRGSKALLVLVICASVPQLATAIYSHKLPVEFYNGYILIDSIAWPFIYYLLLPNKKPRKEYRILGIFNSLPVIGIFILFGYSTRFYYELVCMNNVFQVLYVAYFFYSLNAGDDFVDLRRLPAFWYSMGLLIYATCTFFVFLFWFEINKYYKTSGDNYLWRVHDIFNIAMYILFAVGISVNQPKNKERDA